VRKEALIMTLFRLTLALLQLCEILTTEVSDRNVGRTAADQTTLDRIGPRSPL